MIARLAQRETTGLPRDKALVGLVIVLALVVEPWGFSPGGTAAQQTRDARPAATATAKPPAPSGTGAVTGIVTNDDGSKPVRFAHVLLLGTVTGLVKVTSTDTDGRFSFGSLPADRFTIGASKQPYIGTIAGSKRPGRPGTAIVVAAGQKVSNVAIKMPMGAAITGVITDEKGQPGTSISVALQQWKMQNGERVLVQAPGSATAFTDDRGRYRFYGLPPGEYVVSAMRNNFPPAVRPLSPAEIDEAIAGRLPTAQPPPSAPVRYAPVYFPGTTRSGDATPITLGLGEERQNVDYRLELVTMSRVEGTIVSADGQPVGNVSLIVTNSSGTVFSTTLGVRTGPDGRFSFTNGPGTYTMLASGTGTLSGQFASANLEIAGNDVFGVQVVMRPGLTLNGQLAFEGRGSVPSVTNRRIPVRNLSSPAIAFGTFNLTSTTPQGTFTMTNVVPGRYAIGGPLSFGPTADTMTWALQSVVVDGKDITDLALEVTADAPPKNIVVTYSDRFQELSGRLQSQSGAAVSDYAILVFPEDKAYWIQGTRRIVTARPGTDGRFTLSGPGPTTLPPGRYLLAAVTDIGKDEQFDPAFLAQIVPAGIPIVLGPGEKKVQDLAIK